MYATLEETAALSAARELGARVNGAKPGGAEGLDVLEAQVSAEAGVWAPLVARRAVAQSRGDIARAVALVRVWAAALPQLTTKPVSADDVQITRRLSAAYPDVPGGQWLGPSPELASRLLEWDDTAAPDAPSALPGDETERPRAARNGHDLERVPKGAEPPTRASLPRVRDLVAGTPVLPVPDDGEGADPAGSALAPPLDRATRVAVLARGDTAGLVTLAALTLGRRREAVLAEVTTGIVTVRGAHPRTGVPCRLAEVPVVEAEALVDAEVDGRSGFAIGWGASLGTIERRAIALALLDGALQADAGTVAASLTIDDATVMAAVDGSATNGFVDHLRLPHYASFAAYVDQARRATSSPDGIHTHDDGDDDA
jgi:alpha-D-ribose 1-methylphosphonate 5-triphosphate synthase subunit PhnI